MGEYVGRFGETSFSIDLRSQLMLESYVSALDQAMGELASKPLGRYEDLNFGGWDDEAAKATTPELLSGQNLFMCIRQRIV